MADLATELAFFKNEIRLPLKLLIGPILPSLAPLLSKTGFNALPSAANAFLTGVVIIVMMFLHLCSSLPNFANPRPPKCGELELGC